MNAVALESRKVTLVETLDRALNKGVVLSGDLTISIADVDLIFVGLKLLLASVETADGLRCGHIRGEHKKCDKQTCVGEKADRAAGDEREKIGVVLPGIDAHPEKVEKGLGKLVLTLIEVIRQLLEKQAVRRVEGKSLTDREIDRLGETLMKLERKMEELKKVFGLKDEDLALNLGTLGDLV